MQPTGKTHPFLEHTLIFPVKTNFIVQFYSDDSLGYEFPFILRAVSDGGRFCALCPWSKFCRGCEIPCNDLPLLEGMLSTSSEFIFEKKCFQLDVF